MSRAADPAARRADGARALAITWGAVRYFHPRVLGREADWDEALATTLRRHWPGDATLDVRAAIEHLLGVLDDPCTDVVNEDESRGVTDTGRPPALRRLEDGTCVLATADFRKLPPGAGLFNVLIGMIAEALEAPRLVIDLRGTTRLFQFSALPYLLGHFVEGEVPLPLMRSRQSLGLRPEVGETITEHRGGLLTSVTGHIRPQAGRPSAVPLALVVGDANEPGYAHALALRQAGRARLVHAAGPVGQAPGSVLALPGGIRVRVRTHEYARSDGTPVCPPDLVVGSAEGVLAAVRTLTSPPPVAPAAGPRPWGPPPSPASFDATFPEREYRLLGLAKLWCAARWFFPYHELCDRPWEEAFAAALPLFEGARDERDYARAIAALTTWLQDSHAQVASPALVEAVGGQAGIGAAVRLVEGRSVVVQTTAGQSGLAVGDVITSVDGTPCAERRSFLGRLLSASTPQARESGVDSLLLAGPPESTAALVIERAGGPPSAVRIPRTPPEQLTHRPHLPVSGTLTAGVGYLDLTRLAAGQAAQAFEEVEHLPGLVIDLRGYPGNAGPQIASRLTGSRVPYARHMYPAPDSPADTSGVVRERVVHIEPARPGRSYEGRVAVLVDESTISQGEVVCLMILGAAGGRARVFGTSTCGAVGNVTDVRLPGQSVVMFSGFAVCHPDGGRVQRKGITPDTVITPTLSAVRAGRDETLEAAVAYLSARDDGPRRAADIDLALNESPYDPLPSVRDAIARAAGEGHRYPDPAAMRLTEALAARYGVPPEHIVLGAGSASIAQHLLRSVAGPDNEALYAWRSFEAYPQLADLAGVTSRTVPLKDDAHDLEAMADLVTGKTRMIFVCNPNNPTGTVVRAADLTEFLDRVPDDVLVVLDEAYREYVRAADVPDGVQVYRERPNVAVIRTFSKAYGLAGLRVGFLVAHEQLAAAIRGTIVPFSVNRLAQAAAVASIAAEDEMVARVETVVKERDRVMRTLLAEGWEIPPSEANFVWIRLGDRSRAFAEHCAERGIAIRSYPSEGVRVTIGHSAANDAFLAAARAFTPDGVGSTTARPRR